MLSSIRNRLRGSFHAAPSNNISASLASNRAATAVRAPAILRQGAARMTANRVQWDGIVTVKPIDLVATDPTCAKCDYKGCGCALKRWDSTVIGGFRVSLVTDEPCIKHRTFLHRVAERFSFGTADRPADVHVSLQDTAAAVVASSSNSIVQRRTKLSRRRRNREQVASVNRIVRVQANEDFETDGAAGSQQVYAAHNKMPSRIFRDIDCHLDGTYWTAPMGPRRRAVVGL